MDYEPSRIVNQVIFDTKLHKGGAEMETPEEREKFNE